jgi:transcriptional regulator with XRE-family HTH domain
MLSKGAAAMEQSQTLGDVIRERRIALNLTQEELAERIGDGVRQAEVSRLERGRVSLPRRKRLERIAAALDIPLGELLARAGWAAADRSFRPQTVASTPPSAKPDSPAQTANDAAGRYDGTVDIAQLRSALNRSIDIRERTAELLQQSAALRARWNEGAFTRRSSSTT